MIGGGETREANAVIGGKEQGKSTFTSEIIEMYRAAGERVVILTETEPHAYKKYPRVKLVESLGRPDCPRVVKYYNRLDARRMLKDVYRLCVDGKIKSGLLVMEDATNYLDPWPVIEVRQFLTNHRMFHLDIIITSHSLDLFPNFCRKMVSSVTIFQTAEVFEKDREIKSLKYGNHVNLFKAWQKCMRTPKNKKSYIQYHETIATGI
jgi:hypothetical protein